MNVFDWLKKLAGNARLEAAESTPSTVAGTRRAKPVTTVRAATNPTLTVPSTAEKAETSIDESLTPSAAEKKAMVVGGLDFLNAIKAHQKWKTRLASYVAGTSSEKLDYHLVCRDDQCILGKWINGPGAQAYGSRPVFSRLKMTHAQFHLSAGAIVQLTDEGKSEQARNELRQGDYTKHSVKVQGLISTLYMEVAEA